MLRGIIAAVAVSIPMLVTAIDNGLGLLPPMGWRSWNCYHGDITQDLMELTMDKMAERTRTVDGKATSLLDLGYANCGLDDNWQACGKGVNGSFHDAKGAPIINTDRFPDMSSMTAHGHAKGIRVGWYMNNCICGEHQFSGDMIAAVMESSAKAVAEYGYDGLKLDGCSQFRNLTWWASLLNATGRHILIENCHWGGTVPGQTTGDGPCVGTSSPSDCPYNFYRTSGDISNNWNSMFNNLQTTIKFSGDPALSRPGTWAYPDMLEVCRMASHDEDQSHFGAWAIISAPLILGFDLNNSQTMDACWDIISNTEAIAVSQTWAGHPGTLAKEWTPPQPNPNASQPLYPWGVACGSSDEKGWAYDAATKHITALNGKVCLDGDGDDDANNIVHLSDCSSSPSQQFEYDASTKAITQVSSKKCLDVYDFTGPIVQLYACNKGTNQQFDFSDGYLKDASGQCLAARPGVPGNPGAQALQMWYKPLGDSAMAVLVVNNDINAHKVTIQLSDLNVTGTVAVRDIWAHADLPKATGSIDLGNIATHASRFFKLTPA
eukprot:m.301214 g.301214  ORF g.301214 m.301214 type:complete len:548 (+) comp20137_c0_seq3:73-1716(+)